jgi:hypothetical protein
MMKLRKCVETWVSQENGHFSLNNGSNSSTLSCAVVDISLVQINCSQNFLLKMGKKIVQTSIGRYK